MQNIDLIYLLEPVAATAMALALVLYWRRARSLTKWVLAYSLAAYALAILVKTAFQSLTIGLVAGAGSPFLLGAYYGLQTMLLEVGLAYVFARLAISRGRMSRKDAAGYGMGLAFWENGVLLGAFSAINIAAIYVALASGGPAATAAYSSIASTQPALFYPVQQAISPLLLGILERMSSIMLHAAWGFLVFIAAFYRKRSYLLMALPMGLVDFFVPFAGYMGVAYFEALVFAIALASVAVALRASRRAPAALP